MYEYFREILAEMELAREEEKNSYRPVLHRLICKNPPHWPDVIERVRTHPHEIGYYPCPPEQRCTALRALLQRDMPFLHNESGNEIATVIRAILQAADAIDYTGGGEDLLEIGDKGGLGMSGSWRLLLDHESRWSHLHSFFFARHRPFDNAIEIVKALLQMDGKKSSSVHSKQFQRQILALVDSRNQTVLHHMLRWPRELTDEAVEIIQLIAELAPCVIFQEDDRGWTPLDHVVQYWSELETPTNDDRKRHELLTLFVGLKDAISLSRDCRDRYSDAANLPTQLEFQSNLSSRAIDASHNNILQAACLLPSSVISQFTFEYLTSNVASVMEDTSNMAADQNGDGNSALHLFLSNQSYDWSIDSWKNREFYIMAKLLFAYPRSLTIINRNNDLPLRIAMRRGLRQAVEILLMCYPGAVHCDETLSNPRFFVHVLGCIAVPSEHFFMPERHFTEMFNLLRSRPDLFTYLHES